MPTIRRSSALSFPRNPSREAWFLGSIWGLFLSLVPLLDFALRPPRGGNASYSFDLVREAPPRLAAALAVMLALQIVPALIVALRYGIDVRRASRFALVALLNGLAVIFSLMQVGSVTSMLSALLVTYAFLVCALLAALKSQGRLVFSGLLNGVAVGHAIVLLLVIHDHNFSYGRLMGRSGPNYWGMMSIVTVFSSLSIRQWWIKLPLIAIAAAALVLCQARGSMLAVLAGGVLVWLLVLATTTPLRRTALLMGTAAVGALGVLLASNFILNHILLVTSHDRGLSSGASGRAGAWVQTFELFASHPWLGVGYRQHQNFITAASSAHNAYLATLADTGVVGFFFYMWLLIGALYLSIRTTLATPGRTPLAVSGFLFAYLVVGLVERFALNTGNSMSLLMLLASAWAFRKPPVMRRRGIVAAPKRTAPAVSGRSRLLTTD